MKKGLIALVLCLPLWLEASPKGRVLYNSLDPLSISQHLAFYELYPQTQEGREALIQAWRLLSGSNPSFDPDINHIPYFISAVDSIVRLVNKKPQEESGILDDNALKVIESLASHLPNRKLKGKTAHTEAEVLALTPEQIDLARGLFLSQFSQEPFPMQKIRSYEAMIDLMALQLLARIGFDAKPEEKIRAMNDFIFYEMGFRFPPHSLYAKDVDLYTFLPSVLDSRKGVCLGVSILYICLAQRLDLPLEMITPPGHIYVRYRNGDHIINIETTARGIDLDSKEYLSVDTRSLQQRTIKEVIGLAHFNQAAVHLQAPDYEKAAACYERAVPYLPQDMLLKEFLALNYLFTGRTKEGEALLKETAHHIPDYAVSGDSMAEDYLKGYVDAEGLKTILMSVDEKRESIIKKREALEKTMARCPQFRAGYFNLAITWLQLHRVGEALEILNKYHEMDPTDPTAEYYLAMINGERLNYAKAWEHLNQARRLAAARNHDPEALDMLRKELAAISPE